MIITNGIIIKPDREIRGKALLIEGSKIKSIIDEKDPAVKQGHEVIDAEQGYILPGLIDIHTHGAMGSDFMDAEVEAFKKIARFQARHGVTVLVGATLTASLERIEKVLNTIKDVCNVDIGGSKLLGVHLEGPFLSYENRGAHPPDYLLKPSAVDYGRLLAYSDIIKIVTLSPELPGAIELIDKLQERGIVISGGHDMAVDREILEAIEHGMTHTTHIYCSMSTITRRDSTKHIGLTEFALLDDRLTIEIIADNKHIPPLLAKLLYKCKGPDKMAIVSDSLRVAGLPNDDRVHKIGPPGAEESLQVVVDDGVAMLPDRSINAGSITPLDKMIKNLVFDCEISLVDAVRMGSLTPAEIIRIADNKGSLAEGKDSDICLMDRDLNVIKTIVEGRVVYKKGQEKV